MKIAMSFLLIVTVVLFSYTDVYASEEEAFENFLVNFRPTVILIFDDYHTSKSDFDIALIVEALELASLDLEVSDDYPLVIKGREAEIFDIALAQVVHNYTIEYLSNADYFVIEEGTSEESIRSFMEFLEENGISIDIYYQNEELTLIEPLAPVSEELVEIDPFGFVNQVSFQRAIERNGRYALLDANVLYVNFRRTAFSGAIRASGQGFGAWRHLVSVVASDTSTSIQTNHQFNHTVTGRNEVSFLTWRPTD